jgi:hypothetical protein
MRWLGTRGRQVIAGLLTLALLLPVVPFGANLALAGSAKHGHHAKGGAHHAGGGNLAKDKSMFEKAFDGANQLMDKIQKLKNLLPKVKIKFRNKIEEEIKKDQQKIKKDMQIEMENGKKDGTNFDFGPAIA